MRHVAVYLLFCAAVAPSAALASTVTYELKYQLKSLSVSPFVATNSNPAARPLPEEDFDCSSDSDGVLCFPNRSLDVLTLPGRVTTFESGTSFGPNASKVIGIEERFGSGPVKIDVTVDASAIGFTGFWDPAKPAFDLSVGCRGSAIVCSSASFGQTNGYNFSKIEKDGIEFGVADFGFSLSVLNDRLRYIDDSANDFETEDGYLILSLGVALDHEKTDETVTVSPVPLPASAVLLLFGIAGLYMLRRKST